MPTLGSRKERIILECSVYLLCHRFNKEFRGVKRCQDGCFYGFHDVVAHGFCEMWVGVDKLLQLLYRFCHVAAYGLVRPDIQYLFDTPETGI